MNSVIKLNTRGTIMYVDEAILKKSHFFRNMLFGDTFKKTTPQDDGSYYVDCDSDVMTELIAYMETGHFKHKKINPMFMNSIMDKYGIDIIDNNINKQKETNINILIDAIICHIAGNVSSNFTQICVRFIDCGIPTIEFVTLSSKQGIFSSGRQKIMIGCKYDDKKYNLSSQSLKKAKKYIFTSLEKHKVAKILYLDSIRGISDLEISFEKILDGTKNENNEQLAAPPHAPAAPENDDGSADDDE